MSTTEIRQKLIEKIRTTENQDLLEEVYRLLELENEDSDIFKLEEKQKALIDVARQQIKDGQFLTDEQANKEIDEWLNK